MACSCQWCDFGVSMGWDLNALCFAAGPQSTVLASSKKKTVIIILSALWIGDKSTIFPLIPSGI